jgi:hypothetical protein
MFPSQSRRGEIHPLFDPASPFRRAMAQSTFRADNGERSIRDFFEDRRRVGVHQDWGREVPDEPQDWGLGPAADRMIHKYLLGATVPERSHVVSPQAIPHAGDAARRTPALLAYRFDLGLEWPPMVIGASSRAGPPFTGCGEEDGGGRDISAFYVHIDREHVPELPDGHLALLLVMTHSALDILGPLVLSEAEPPMRLAPEGVAGEDEAIRIITRSLSVAMLTAARPRLRAARVSHQLALCPALQAIIREGSIERRIRLSRESPPLEDGTFVVLCVGPRAGTAPGAEGS